MPKTTAVPFDLRQEILKIHHLDPARSARKIAEEFGLHHKTISRILRDIPVTFERPESKYEVPLTENLVETSVVDGDSWMITLPKTRICTLEQLVEHCQIDLRIWEVERWVCNKWEMGYKDKEGEAKVEPLFQVKAFLKKRKEMEAALREIEDLKGKTGLIKSGATESTHRATSVVTRSLESQPHLLHSKPSALAGPFPASAPNNYSAAGR